MAKLDSKGRLHGRVGDMVFSVRNDKQCVSRRPSVAQTKTPSLLQQFNRRRMKLVQQVVLSEYHHHRAKWESVYHKQRCRVGEKVYKSLYGWLFAYVFAHSEEFSISMTDTIAELTQDRVMVCVR